MDLVRDRFEEECLLKNGVGVEQILEDGMLRHVLNTPRGLYYLCRPVNNPPEDLTRDYTILRDKKKAITLIKHAVKKGSSAYYCERTVINGEETSSKMYHADQRTLSNIINIAMNIHS